MRANSTGCDVKERRCHFHLVQRQMPFLTFLKKSLLIALFAVSFAVWGGDPDGANNAKASLIGYQAHSDTNSTLWTINLATGHQTLIGLTGVASLQALDISPTDGCLYGLSYYNLYRINTANGIATKIADNILPYGAKSMSFAPDGTLYAVQSVSGTASLYTLDIVSGAASLVSDLSPITNVTALAIDSQGNGIGWSSDTWPGLLFTLNLSSGSSHLLGTITVSNTFEAFDYAPDGTLYGTNWGDLYTIDPVNVTRSWVASFSQEHFNGYGFCVIPEPSTIALLATGVASLLFIAWQRRKRSQ